MSLTQLRSEMTPEELYLWVAYFGLMQDLEEEAMQKLKDAVANIGLVAAFSWPKSQSILRSILTGLARFRKLERNFKRLEKLTSDLLVKLNTATAERQLRGLDRDVDRLKKNAGNVVVGFNVDKSGLRNAKRELEGISGGGGAGGAGLLSLAAGASAIGGISEVSKDLAEGVRAAKSLESAIEKVKENVKEAGISLASSKACSSRKASLAS